MSDNEDTQHNASFPFFRLPPELRCMIQGCAIRDFQRGVHFFATSESPRWHGPNLGPPSIFNFDYAYGLDLTAPKGQSNPSAAQDWIQGNPSAYTRDVALWTMCWESHDNMTRRYKKLGQQMDPPFWSIDQFSLCKFRRHGEDHEFKVSPEQDLFCIQPQFTEDPWCIMPFYRLPGSPGFTRLTNTAMEYDPNWLSTWERIDVPHQERSPRGCFIRTLWAMAEGKMPHGFRFWIIDRTIQRRDKPRASLMSSEDSVSDEEHNPEPLVFQGLDRRYVELRGLEECNWDATKQNTAFHFLHWLQIRVGFSSGWMMRHRRPEDLDNPPLQYIDLAEMVAVLCEEKL